MRVQILWILNLNLNLKLFLNYNCKQLYFEYKMCPNLMKLEFNLNFKYLN